MSIYPHKALVIFAKNPVPGRVKTRLSPPLEPAAAADFYRCMLGDLLAKASHLTGIDKYLYYEGGADAGHYFQGPAREMECRPQQGKDLGEKMAAAFRQLFAEGYGAAAIIGSDSPDLPRAYIEEAFVRLENDGCDAVFGPTEDGGYYLVGMTRLQEDLFREIPWSSGEVLRESLRRAERAGLAVSLLPVWYDLDTAADLDRPGLMDEANDAPLTRGFLKNRL